MISERSQALENDQSLSIETKICFAASDYLYGLNNKAFAENNGGIDVLKSDLETFLDCWRESSFRVWKVS